MRRVKKIQEEHDKFKKTLRESSWMLFEIMSNKEIRDQFFQWLDEKNITFPRIDFSGSGDFYSMSYRDSGSAPYTCVFTMEGIKQMFYEHLASKRVEGLKQQTKDVITPLLKKPEDIDRVSKLTDDLIDWVANAKKED